VEERERGAEKKTGKQIPLKGRKTLTFYHENPARKKIWQNCLKKGAGKKKRPREEKKLGFP